MIHPALTGRAPQRGWGRPGRRPVSAPARRVLLAGAALLAGLAALALAVTSGASAVAGQPHRPARPSADVGSSLAAARAGLAGVHEVRVVGQLSEVQSGIGVYVGVRIEAGLTSGTLSETIASRGKRVSLGAVITPRRGYCTGDPDALTTACSMSAAQAWAAVGHWVSFGPHTAAYRAVAASVNYGDDLAGLLPASPSGFSRTRTRSLAGRHVVELRGPASPDAGFPVGTVETIDLSTGRRPLPLEARFEDPGRVSSTEWFAGWGAAFAVHPPARSVPAASLG